MEEKSEGLLRGLVNLLKALDELAEGSAEVKGRTKLMGTEVEYRYSGRYLFQYAKPSTISVEKEAREPLVDIFDRGDHLSVVAAIPNVKEEDLKFKIARDTVTIGANVAGTKIEKEVSIPKGSEVDRVLGYSFKNGVLEIRLKKKAKFQTTKVKG